MMRPECLVKDVAARMGVKRGSRWSCLVGSCLLAACAAGPRPSPRDLADANDTGGNVAAANEHERALLQRIPRLPSGSPQDVGPTKVVAEPPYVAASGRHCRAVHIQAAAGESRHRLACSDGKAWFFAPDVFGSELPR